MITSKLLQLRGGLQNGNKRQTSNKHKNRYLKLRRLLAEQQHMGMEEVVRSLVGMDVCMGMVAVEVKVMKTCLCWP